MPSLRQTVAAAPQTPTAETGQGRGWRGRRGRCPASTRTGPATSSSKPPGCSVSFPPLSYVFVFHVIDNEHLQATVPGLCEASLTPQRLGWRVFGFACFPVTGLLEPQVNSGNIRHVLLLHYWLTSKERRICCSSLCLENRTMRMHYEILLCSYLIS